MQRYQQTSKPWLVVNDNTGSTKARSVTNKVSHEEENKISIEDFMMKVGRNRDPNHEKETLKPIIIKDAQDVRNEMRYQQRDTWMNRDPKEKNSRGETPIQEVNRILEEQSSRSYGSRDRERKNKAKAKKYDMKSHREWTLPKLRAMKAGETTQGTPKKRIRTPRGQLDKRTPQAIAIEEERERETAHAALSHCGERTLDETITKGIMDGMENLQTKQQMYTKLGKKKLCRHCQRGKNSKKSTKNTSSPHTDKPKGPGTDISADVIGPFTPSICGATYMLVIVCMKTKYMYVKSISDQADLHIQFEEYRALMKAKDVTYKRVALNISKLCTDHASNMMCIEMKIWRHQHFITEFQSAPYSQHQNFVESKIQTLFQGGVSSLSSSGFPNFMLHHMIIMKAESMNAHWCEGSDLSPLEERFGVRAHIKDFIPAGTVMYVNLPKDNRVKSGRNERCEIMYWCGRPSHGGGALAFSPGKNPTIFVRHHYTLDSRVVYGDILGERFAAQQRLDKQYMKWSLAEKAMFNDKTERGAILDEMLRNKTHLDPIAMATEKALITQALALLSGTGSDILITEAIEARRKALGGPYQDEDDTDSDAGEHEEEDEEIPETVTQISRGKRERKKKVEETWNPMTKEYESKQRLCRSRQAILSQSNTMDQHLTCTVARISRNDKIICGNLYHRLAQIRIFCIYSGTGSTIRALQEAMRNTGIRAQVVALCENDPTLRKLLQYHHNNIPTFEDIATTNITEVPKHNIVMMSPPCQDFSIAGKQLGWKGPNSKTLYPLLKTLMRSRPDIIIGEQVRNFLHIDGGKSFEKMADNAGKDGYHFSYGVIQLAKLNVPQYRERIWCIAIRGDVHHIKGDISIPLTTTDETPPTERMTIGQFLEGNPTYTTVFCAKKEMTPDRGQVYQQYKPHRKGTIYISTGSKELNTYRTTEHIVWGQDGISPCIRTQNRIFILIKHRKTSLIEEITLEGLAALQGIPLHHLPHDLYKARRAIGNAINGHMHTHILTEVLQYYDGYLKLAEENDIKKREAEKAKESCRNLANRVHARTCRATARTYEERRQDEQEEKELYRMRLTNLKRQQQRHNRLLLDTPIDQSHNGTHTTTSRCKFDQAQPENESRYPRTLLAKIQRNCLTMNSQEETQHERDDSSEKETELHTYLVNTQSKAPRTQDNETQEASEQEGSMYPRTMRRNSQSIDERWKRAKVAQTTTKTTWKLRKADDPQAMAQEKKNEEKTRAKAQSPKAKEERKFIKSVGDRWKADFRRIAISKGATEEDLNRADKAHLQPGARQKLMEALKTLMEGDENACQTIAEQLAKDGDMDPEIYKATAEYQANNSWQYANICKTKTEVTNAYHEGWKTADDWEPAKDITAQLARPDGEGAETFKEAKGEVDHMRDTGSFITCDRNDPTVMKDLEGCDPVDTKWVIVRKLKKCHITSKMVFARLRLRLTLRGFKQRAGRQFDEYGTFAPVMHLGSMMLLLVIATMFKLHIRMADDSKAFCEGVMDYKVYTTLPKPFCNMEDYAIHGKDTLWLLVNAIYGLKQAARQYFAEVVSHCNGPMQMTQSQRDPCVFIKWFTKAEVDKCKIKEAKATRNIDKTDDTESEIKRTEIIVKAHRTNAKVNDKFEMQDLVHEEDGEDDGRSNQQEKFNEPKKKMKRGKHKKNLLPFVSFILFGAWVDDKLIITVDLCMYDHWLLPKMNERFITNCEGEPRMILGTDADINDARDEIRLHHHTNIRRFLKKNNMENLKSNNVPSTPKLVKEMKDYKYKNSPEEARETAILQTPYRQYLGAMGHWSQTSMPQLKAPVRIASKYMQRPLKIHYKLIMMMIKYCAYCVENDICLILKRGEVFDGVLDLMFMSDSDHCGNSDGTSNSGMVAYMNNNYFYGYSSGQKCVTVNTAESEYVALVKCLQFAIWTMLLLRELGFRLRFPIPVLGDNVASLLIAKSPTHTKFARHIDLKTHYIRQVLPFRDFILAYIATRWNVADLNTKGTSPEVFLRLSPLMLQGLHGFNWKENLLKTLNEIWEQTKARDDQKQLDEQQGTRNQKRKEARQLEDELKRQKEQVETQEESKVETQEESKETTTQVETQEESKDETQVETQEEKQDEIQDETTHEKRRQKSCLTSENKKRPKKQKQLEFEFIQNTDIPTRETRKDTKRRKRHKK